jgi:hypothetical protein
MKREMIGLAGVNSSRKMKMEMIGLAIAVVNFIQYNSHGRSLPLHTNLFESCEEIC